MLTAADFPAAVFIYPSPKGTAVTTIIGFMLSIVAGVLTTYVPRVELPSKLRGKKMPIVTLTNGLVVGNFSSPHTFTFTDGSVLPACSSERATLAALQAVEKDVSGKRARWTDIKIDFELSEQTEWALHEAAKEPVDIIIVPRVVRDAMAAKGRDIRKTKFRTIRMADRVKKVAFADKFCV